MADDLKMRLLTWRETIEFQEQYEAIRELFDDDDATPETQKNLALCEVYAWLLSTAAESPEIDWQSTTLPTLMRYGPAAVKQAFRAVDDEKKTSSETRQNGSPIPSAGNSELPVSATST